MELLTIQGQPASILGLAGKSIDDSDAVLLAFTARINYFFFYNLESQKFLSALKSLLATKCEQVLVGFFITSASFFGYRTIPHAQRTLSNQLDQVFSLFV